MTGNVIKGLAQKRVRDTSTNVDWDNLFRIVIDEIFTHATWRFARLEISYVHPQNFEYRFNHDATELALNKIYSARMTTSYTLVAGVPVPVTNTALDLVYLPYKDFVNEFPDHIDKGDPEVFTIIEENDGIRGMQIGLYRVPSSDAAVWIFGEFMPSYTIGASEIAILPKQFHRLIIDGLVHYAAEELAKERLAVSARARFELGKRQLETWDLRNPAFHPIRKPYTRTTGKGPFFPGNFQRGYSRW